MAGHESDIAPDIETGLVLKYPQCRDRNGHKRRLGVFSQREGLGRTAPDRVAEPLAQSGIDVVEYLARRSKCLGQSLAHSDGLAALARENQRNCHRLLFAPQRSLRAQGRREKYRHDTDVKAITGHPASNKQGWAWSDETLFCAALPF